MVVPTPSPPQVLLSAVQHPQQQQQQEQQAAQHLLRQQQLLPKMPQTQLQSWVLMLDRQQAVRHLAVVLAALVTCQRTQAQTWTASCCALWIRRARLPGWNSGSSIHSKISTRLALQVQARLVGLQGMTVWCRLTARRG